mmetsp:Transcript_4688/g.4645  ORF Transcript_4688/g.4645 Transcript_4688/m.4645 type:complete len:202 (-) Transcript_4688:92-697(-)
MMQQRIQEIFALFFLFLLVGASAFSSPESSHPYISKRPSSSPTALNVGMNWLDCENDCAPTFQTTEAVVASTAEPTEADSFRLFHLLSRVQHYAKFETIIDDLDEVQSVLDDLAVHKKIHGATMADDQIQTLQEAVASLQWKIDVERVQTALVRTPVAITGALMTMCLIQSITVGMWLVSPVRDAVDQHSLPMGHLGFNRE